jgi:hypothetical protein
VRLSRIKVFDPACGSGNFLIIAYKEIRQIEIEILKRIQELEDTSLSGTIGLFDESHSAIRLEQFYGIELDDFAHEIAVLSLWLVEHQMNMVFETEFGYTAPTLPLKACARIVAGNSARIDWELLCPFVYSDEIYILGNPPYVGARNQNKNQKSDMRYVLNSYKGVNSLDYISIWFFKAINFIKGNNAKIGFVSTNSIVQGEQVSLLWQNLLQNSVEINYAFESFKWENNAKDKAAVICVIIGLRNISDENKYIYSSSAAKKVKNISPYLTSNEDVFIAKRSKPLSKLPKMEYGNQPVDGGGLKLTKEEKEEMTGAYPAAEKFLKRLIGGSEFIKNTERWCIWVEDNELIEAKRIPSLAKRFDVVRLARESGGEVAQSLLERCHQFRYRHRAKNYFILMPRTSSERREYIPVGLLSHEVISLESAQVMYDPEPFVFGVISSKMHMVWTLATSGRLKSDIRYSTALTYNTFPLPKLSKSQKEQIEILGLEILAIRENYPDKTISDLYDPEKMPNDLKLTHQQLDKAIENLYSASSYKTDDERLSALINLYKKMTRGI